MKITAYIYFLLSLIVIFADFISGTCLHYFAKPLLMPLLMLLYFQSVSGALMRRDYLFLAALFFAWIGDLALMIPGGHIIYFLLGLLSFLITHLFYISVFTMVKDKSVSPILKSKPWVLIPLIAYLIALLSVVFPALAAELKIPVTIYTAVLSTMLMFSINRYKRVSDTSFALVFSGALLFMISDSLIAVDHFVCHGTLWHAGVWIMGLYMAGQYFIVKGMIASENRD